MGAEGSREGKSKQGVVLMVNETNITPGKGHDEEAAKSAVPQNVRDELLDQSIESLGRDTQLTPQLEDAIGMVKRWDARRAAAKEVIRKGRFKNDEEGYRRFLEYLAPYDAATRNNLIKYEEAQTRQAIKVQNAANRKKLEDGSKSVTITANNASIAEFAEKRHTAQTEYESEINTLEKQWDEFKAFQRMVEGDVSVVAEMTKDDPELAERHKRMLDSLGEKAVEYTNKRAEIQKKKDDALAAAKASYDEQMAANRNTLRKWYEDSVNRETQFQMKCGYKPDTAFTIAVSEIGKDSQSMLCGLIDAGQGDFVQTFLDELKKDDAGLKKVVRKDDNGNPVKSPNGGELFDWEWNPHGRLCMSIDQVASVQDYLNRKITADIQRNKLVAKQQEEAFDLEASKIRSEINQMDVLPTLNMERVKTLYEAANQLSAQGYDKAHLVTANITSVVNRHARRAQALQKMEAKAAAAQTKELGDIAFRQMIDKFAARPDGVFTVDMMLPDDTGKPVLTKVEMNSNNAIAHTIQTAQSLGFLKGANWTKMMGEALAVESQRKVVEVAVNELFDFPVDDSIIVKEYGMVRWGDRLEGSSTTITIGLGDHGSVKPDNVGSNMRVRSKVGATVSHWYGNSTEQRYLTSDQLGKVVAEAHRFVKDNPAATKESLMAHLGKVRDRVLLESDAATFGTRMMNGLTKANDDFFTNDVYGGMRNGRIELARGRTPIGQLIRQSAMNARFNPAYSALTKNAIIFGDDEEPDLNAMQDEAVEE